MRHYILKIDLPYLHKGHKFAFEDETGLIYGFEDDGKMMQYPLRYGLSGYLWLLLTDGKKYFRESNL